MYRISLFFFFIGIAFFSGSCHFDSSIEDPPSQTLDDNVSQRSSEECSCQIKINSVTGSDHWALSTSGTTCFPVNPFFGFDQCECAGLSTTLGVWYDFDCNVPIDEWVTVNYSAAYRGEVNCNTFLNDILSGDPCPYLDPSTINVTVRCREPLFALWHYETFDISANYGTCGPDGVSGFEVNELCEFSSVGS